MTPPLRGTAALQDSELETFRAPQYFDFTSEATLRTQQQQRIQTTNTRSTTTSDDTLIGEQFIPGAEGVNIFRAHEILVEYPEVQGIVRWLDGLRENGGMSISAIDVDLTNGIALVDAMSLISPKLLDGKKVLKDYVRPSSVAEHNIALLRGTLACFPWRDEVRDVSVSPDVDFVDLSPWSLAGYVLAAAVNCPDRERFIEDLMQFDMQTQDLLDSTVQRAYKALGICYGQDDRVSLGDSQNEEVEVVTMGEEGHEREDKDLEGLRDTFNALSTSDASRNSGKTNFEEEVHRLREELKNEKAEKEVLKAQVCDLEEEVGGWKEHAQSLEKLATDMAAKSQKAKDEMKKVKGSNSSLRKKLEALRKEMISSKENQQSTQVGSPILKPKDNGTEYGQSTVVKKLVHEKQELSEKAASVRRENAKLRREVKEAQRKLDLAAREIDRLHRSQQRSSRRIASTTLPRARTTKR